MTRTDAVTVEVAVDPVTAFEVFTEEIDSWYQRGPYSWKFPDRAVGIRFEPRAGGRLLEVHDAATGEGFAFGEVRVWEPGKRLVFTDLVARYVDGDGRVREAEMLVGDSQLWLSGRDPGYWDEKGRRPEQLTLIWVDDVDAHYARVTAAGVDAKPPEDKSYGVRTYGVTDPEGYEWGFMTPTGKGFEQSEGGLTEVRASR